jgi:hypothetical protein
MLHDITTYYSEENENKAEQDLGVVGCCDFELCGLPIIEGEEYIHNGKIYCSKYHKDEQIQIEKDGE